MTPNDSQRIVDHDGHDVDEQGEVPGYSKVRCRPKQPCLDVVLHVASVFVRMGFIPIEVDDQGRCNDEAGQEGRAHQGPKRERQKSA